MRVKKGGRLLTALSTLGLFSSLIGSAQAVSIPDFKKEIDLLVRPRWEYVNIKNDGKSAANAGTVRAQLGFKLSSSSLVFYEENTWVVSFYDHYEPESSGYEFVADEPRFRITQLWGMYKGKLGSAVYDVKLGRQVINIDNQRFVGAVDWRQTPQTFDAARADVKANLPLKPRLMLAYICDRQGVLSTLTTYRICGNAALSYSFLGHLELSLPLNTKGAIYGYHFRWFADAYGANLHGNVPVKNIFGLNYWLEYAHEVVHNKVSNIWGTANYFHINVGGSLKTAYGKPFANIGYERFGKYFVTPLATLHKFNGWADVFLKYTAASDTYGLNDYYFTLGVINNRYGKFMGVFHHFTATKDFPGGGNKFGNEIDLLYTKNILKNLNLTLKLADYNASGDAKNAGIGDKDTTKAWIMLTYRFGASF